jgi:hypothetical protein
VESEHVPKDFDGPRIVNGGSSVDPLQSVGESRLKQIPAIFGASRVVGVEGGLEDPCARAEPSTLPVGPVKDRKLAILIGELLEHSFSDGVLPGYGPDVDHRMIVADSVCEAVRVVPWPAWSALS